MSNCSFIDNIPKTWGFLLRVILKALFLFGLCNLIFALVYPMELIGKLSLYGYMYPARPRLPYGENPSESYNVSLTNLTAMFASHEISSNTVDDEYRVILIGDSNTWGWLLNNEETLSAQINQANLTINGQRVVSYNLGYPVMSLAKDLLILDEAMNYQPDMIIWLISLASFPPEQQVFSPLVQNNLPRLRLLIEENELNINPNNEQFYQPNIWERTIVGQRRQLADLLRLQTYGLSWATTGIDQAIPENITLRQSDFEEDYSWSVFDEPTILTQEDLVFDVLQAAITLTDDVPIFIVNEPIFISDGENSEVRYNSFYPRWAYDQYRDLLRQYADENDWQYIDLWDTIPAQGFTDSPIHITAEGTQALAEIIIDNLAYYGE